MTNVILENLLNLVLNWSDSLSLKSVREKISHNIPDFNSIVENRAAYSLSNSHFVTHGSWPYYQNVIEVGGIHCKPGKVLPSEMKQLMDSHPSGVVYVSFGSAVKPSVMNFFSVIFLGFQNPGFQFPVSNPTQYFIFQVSKFLTQKQTISGLL